MPWAFSSTAATGQWFNLYDRRSRVRGEPALVPDLSLPEVLLRGATPADQVGGVRHDLGNCGNLPLPGTVGLLPGRWRYAFCSARTQGRLRSVVPAPPSVHGRSSATLAPVRHRRGHQPYPRLRLTDRHAGRTLLRWHRRVAEGLRLTHRPAVHPRGRGFNPPDRCSVHAS